MEIFRGAPWEIDIGHLQEEVSLEPLLVLSSPLALPAFHEMDLWSLGLCVASSWLKTQSLQLNMERKRGQQRAASPPDLQGTGRTAEPQGSLCLQNISSSPPPKASRLLSFPLIELSLCWQH